MLKIALNSMFKMENVQKLRFAYDILRGAITGYMATMSKLKLMFLSVGAGYNGAN